MQIQPADAPSVCGHHGSSILVVRVVGRAHELDRLANSAVLDDSLARGAVVILFRDASDLRVEAKDLRRAAGRYPEIVELSALGRAPQHLAHFLRDLANEFHTYYNAHKFIVDDITLREARLVLVTAVGQVIRNGLELLGVSAPESM